jgi:hypothetical protein
MIKYFYVINLFDLILVIKSEVREKILLIISNELKEFTEYNYRQWISTDQNN